MLKGPTKICISCRRYLYDHAVRKGKATDYKNTDRDLLDSCIADDVFIIEEGGFSPLFFFDDSFLLVCCGFCLLLFLESSDSSLWVDNMASAIFNTTVNDCSKINIQNYVKIIIVRKQLIQIK